MAESTAASLLAALRAGTARMAAMIDAQKSTAMPAILSALETASAPFHVSGPDGGERRPRCVKVAPGVRGVGSFEEPLFLRIDAARGEGR